MLEEFTYTTIEQPSDYEGEVVTTLISYKKNQPNTYCTQLNRGPEWVEVENPRKAILYIHGFVDYFFHPHVAESFFQAGYNFYALELRKYGHSLLAHQKPNYCKSIEEYFQDIDAALERIEGDVILLGHSTGGLVSTLYALSGAYKHRIQGLILNSPFYRFNKPFLLEHSVIPFLGFLSRIIPSGKITKALSENYPMSVHKDYYGEWNFDLSFKPIEGFPAYLSWFRAVIQAQRTIWKLRGTLNMPVLLLRSSHSTYGTRWSNKFLAGDSVLNVKDIKKVGESLGPKVTSLIIPDGLHDLYLSPELIRTNALDQTVAWCKQNVPS